MWCGVRCEISVGSCEVCRLSFLYLKGRQYAWHSTGSLVSRPNCVSRIPGGLRGRLEYGTPMVPWCVSQKEMRPSFFMYDVRPVIEARKPTNEVKKNRFGVQGALAYHMPCFFDFFTFITVPVFLFCDYCERSIWRGVFLWHLTLLFTLMHLALGCG